MVTHDRNCLVSGLFQLLLLRSEALAMREECLLSLLFREVGLGEAAGALVVVGCKRLWVVANALSWRFRPV